MTTLVFLLLGITLGLWPVAGHAEEDASAPATITVLGRGEVTAPPDVVRVTFAVESTASTATDAARDNAERAERVIAAAKTQTGKGGRVFTTGYQLIPMYQDSEEPTHHGAAKPVLVGYRAQNEVVVEIGDPGRTGALIDATVKAGANRVVGMQFDLRDSSAATVEALAAAGRDARRQAEAVATALGVGLGAIHSASAAPEPIHRPYERFSSELRMAAAVTPVEPGDVSVHATLEVRYRIAE